MGQNHSPLLRRCSASCHGASAISDQKDAHGTHAHANGYIRHKVKDFFNCCLLHGQVSPSVDFHISQQPSIAIAFRRQPSDGLSLVVMIDAVIIESAFFFRLHTHESLNDSLTLLLTP